MVRRLVHFDDKFMHRKFKIYLRTGKSAISVKTITFKKCSYGEKSQDWAEDIFLHQGRQLR
jgi:hypothetical protein